VATRYATKAYSRRGVTVPCLAGRRGSLVRSFSVGEASPGICGVGPADPRTSLHMVTKIESLQRGGHKLMLCVRP
jgi:hypothetical protein